MPFKTASFYGAPQTPAQRDYLLDPRTSLARALIAESAKGNPVQSHTEGVSMLGKALLGGYFGNQARSEMRDRENKTAADIGIGIQGAMAKPWTNPDTGQVSNAPTGGYAGLAAALSRTGNPDVAPFAQQAILAQLAADQDAAKQKAALASELFKSGKAIDPKTGAVVPVPGFGETSGQIKAAEARPMIGVEVEKQDALIPGEARKAEAVEGGKLKGQLATGPDGKPLMETIEGIKSGAQAAGKTFDRANTLRDEYNTLTKDFRTVQDAYSKIQATSDTGAGDMSLLYSYVKLLDPGSVVRESEFATAAASGSYGERIQGLAQRIITGERLPKSLRDAFKTEAESIYKAQKGGADRLEKQYRELAGRYGLDPSDVIQSYAPIAMQGAASPDIPSPPPGFQVMQ